MYEKLPLVDGCKHMNQDNLVEMYLDNVWRPNVTITGASGLPAHSKAGNVVRPATTVRISMRLAPDADANKQIDKMEEILTKDPPYNAKLTVLEKFGGNGFLMKVPDQWLSDAIMQAGKTYYGMPSGSYGDGGSIPFLNTLALKYPETHVIAFGVLGPFSNAHGPNEFLELTYTKRLVCSLCHVLV